MSHEAPDECPTCGTCGVPITTGLMAVFCPRRDKCEFWPDDAGHVQFVLWLKGEVDSPMTDGERAALKVQEKDRRRAALDKMVAESEKAGLYDGFAAAKEQQT